MIVWLINTVKIQYVSRVRDENCNRKFHNRGLILYRLGKDNIVSENYRIENFEFQKSINIAL